jgi:hypothetical protein
MHKTVKCWKFYSSNQFKKICIYVADEDKIIEKPGIVWITLKKNKHDAKIMYNNIFIFLFMIYWLSYSTKLNNFTNLDFFLNDNNKKY